MRINSLILIGLLPFAAVAADPTMTRIDFRFIGTDVVPGTFAASSRTAWIAGNCCVRVEEAPDPAHKIHGVIINSEPDAAFNGLWNG